MITLTEEDVLFLRKLRNEMKKTIKRSRDQDYDEIRISVELAEDVVHKIDRILFQ